MIFIYKSETNEEEEDYQNDTQVQRNSKDSENQSEQKKNK
jgi:hypothetical protein